MSERRAVLQALGAVAPDGVGDLVAHHHGQARVRLGHREDAGVDRHLAAGKAEGVDRLGRVDDHDLPLELARDLGLELEGRRHQAIGHPPHLVYLGAGADDLLGLARRHRVGPASARDPRASAGSIIGALEHMP